MLKNLSMIDNSFEEMGCFQRALKEFVTAADATYAKNFDEFLIGFDGRLIKELEPICKKK
jgi:hypothetical protein